VYGEDVMNLDTTEATRVSPTSFYGIGKYTAERLLLRATTEAGIPLAVLGGIALMLNDFVSFRSIGRRTVPGTVPQNP